MICQNLKKYRKQKGFSQDEIASLLHVTRQTISKWERGESTPSADILILLAEKYGVSVYDLLGVVPKGNGDVSRELEIIRRDEIIRERESSLKKFILACTLVISGMIGAFGWLTSFCSLIKDVTWQSVWDVFKYSSDGMVVAVFLAIAVAGVIAAIHAIFSNN